MSAFLEEDTSEHIHLLMSSRFWVYIQEMNYFVIYNLFNSTQSFGYYQLYGQNDDVHLGRIVKHERVAKIGICLTTIFEQLVTQINPQFGKNCHVQNKQICKD